MTNNAMDSSSNVLNNASQQLGDAASRVADSAAGLRQKAMDYGQQAASALDDAATYVRENTMRDIVSDAGKAIKANPIPAVIGAVIVGFVAGQLLRRD
jgi:ElaB/YqjD/DUF883 family membrane-anchored ribosome-binding protein